MKTDMRMDADNLVLIENQAIFDLYALWRALPINILKTMPLDQIESKLGIDDPFILELTKIHSQKAFSEKYEISEDSLTRWNKKIVEADPLFEVKGWTRNLTKNVMLSFYNHTVRKGNPLLYKLWFQVVNDWEESSKIKFAPGNIEFNFTQMPKRPEIKKVEAVEMPKEKEVKQPKKPKYDAPTITKKNI